MNSNRWRRAQAENSRPVVAPLERCAELLGVDLAAVEAAAADLEPYLHADGTPRWSVRALGVRLGLIRPPKRNSLGIPTRAGS